MENLGKSLITQKQKAQSIKMISRGFAAKTTTNIVLKFGDSRPKGRGLRGVDLRKIEEKV